MKATAYVVGPRDGPGAGLTEMVRQFDFATVQPFGGVVQAEQQAARTPVCYFLFAAVDDVSSLRAIADAIRFSANRRIRFSPLMYFSESPSTQVISRCIDMGFDDVITMPFNPHRILERIRRQIGRSFTYYETAGYFGPDRRGRLGSPERPEKAPQGGQFRRLEIVRNLSTGINVVRDDFFQAAEAPQPAYL
ncbi:MAG: hypothetical protein ACOH2L_08000 [Devosia sp.]